MSFAEDMIEPLHGLAIELIDQRHYGRLEMVSHYLNALKNGQWDRLNPAERQRFLSTMKEDFYYRVWDDWDWTGEGNYPTICKQIELYRTPAK